MKLRYYIVEYATMLDEVCSLTLCELLQIKQEESISFGYKTISLSFNHKINLLIDLASVDKEIQRKFQLFAEIRNKFAHVYSVSSYRSYLELNGDTKKTCEKLLSWYNELKKHEDEDLNFLMCFIKLYKELSEYAIEISEKHAYDRGYKVGQQNVLEISNKILFEELEKVNLREEALRKIITALEKS